MGIHTTSTIKKRLLSMRVLHVLGAFLFAVTLILGSSFMGSSVDNLSEETSVSLLAVNIQAVCAETNRTPAPQKQIALIEKARTVSHAPAQTYWGHEPTVPRRRYFSQDQIRDPPSLS